eukprot:6491835-Amphidinium_carterae.2
MEFRKLQVSVPLQVIQGHLAVDLWSDLTKQMCRQHSSPTTVCSEFAIYWGSRSDAEEGTRYPLLGHENRSNRQQDGSRGGEEISTERCLRSVESDDKTGGPTGYGGMERSLPKTSGEPMRKEHSTQHARALAGCCDVSGQGSNSHREATGRRVRWQDSQQQSWKCCAEPKCEGAAANDHGLRGSVEHVVDGAGSERTLDLGKVLRSDVSGADEGHLICALAADKQAPSDTAGGHLRAGDAGQAVCGEERTVDAAGGRFRDSSGSGVSRGHHWSQSAGSSTCEPATVKVFSANLRRRLLKGVENTLSCAYAQKCQPQVRVELVGLQCWTSQISKCPCCKCHHVACDNPNDRHASESVDLRIVLTVSTDTWRHWLRRFVEAGVSSAPFVLLVPQTGEFHVNRESLEKVLSLPNRRKSLSTDILHVIAVSDWFERMI